MRASESTVVLDLTGEHVSHLDNCPVAPVILAAAHISESQTPGLRRPQRLANLRFQFGELCPLARGNIDKQHLTRDQLGGTSCDQRDDAVADQLRASRMPGLLTCCPLLLVEHVDVRREGQRRNGPKEGLARSWPRAVVLEDIVRRKAQRFARRVKCAVQCSKRILGKMRHREDDNVSLLRSRSP